MSTDPIMANVLAINGSATNSAIAASPVEFSVGLYSLGSNQNRY